MFAFEERLDAEDGSALWARGEIDAGEVFEQCAPVIRSCGDSLGGRWRRRVVLAGPIPICESCNSEFGRDLEAPVSRLFADVEEGRGLTDGEAELMVRWMWKFEGYAWKLQHLEGVYSTRCTLRQRVVRPIDQLRGDIVLALSLVAMIDPQYRDAPMGLDSECEHNALFVSGVFSRLAIMIVLKDFTSMVPPQFSKYRLLDKRKPPEQDPKLFFPATRFATCTDAVATAVAASGPLGEAHDAWAEACLAAAGPDYAGGRLT